MWGMGCVRAAPVLADRGAKVAGFATDLHLPFGTPAEYRAAEAPENKSAFEELL